MSLEEYEILGIIGDNLNSASYKVKNKITKEIFMWQAVNCQSLIETEKQLLLQMVNERKTTEHPHMLTFFNYIEHKETNTLYLSTKYCKHGNLKSFIENCNKYRKSLTEEFITRLIYQISFTFKTSRSTVSKLNFQEIFLDENYDVKFLNFDFDSKKLQTGVEKTVQMSQFGKFIYQLCVLHTEDEINVDLQNSQLQSKELIVLIGDMLNDNSDILTNIDKILCHPYILLKSAQWNKEKSFSDNVAVNKTDNKKPQRENLEAKNLVVDYQNKLQKLRNWESALKAKEEQLNERHRILNKKEKKIAITERCAKEKLQQAEIYLRRCRETKSTSSGSSLTKSQKSYEDLEDSVEYSESVIVSTSKKLSTDKIEKPAPFMRTFSERRVRFKGHSPLKEANFIKPRSKAVRKGYPLYEDVPLVKNIQNNVERISESGSDKSGSIDKNFNQTGRKSRKLLSGSKEKIKNDENKPPEYINNDVVEMAKRDIRPISWTEESKKYAFDLLRMMNNNRNGDTQHTYL